MVMLMYGDPGLDARGHEGHPYIASFDEEGDDLPGNAQKFERAQADPDFRVTRYRSLYLIAPRNLIVEEIRNMMHTMIVIVNGNRHVSVRPGSSKFVARARSFWGHVVGAGATAATPLTMLGMAQHNSGSVGSHAANAVLSVAGLFRHNPWSHADRTMSQAVKHETDKLNHTLVEVACTAAAAHAFAAAAAPAAAGGGILAAANSTVAMRDLANIVDDLLNGRR